MKKINILSNLFLIAGLLWFASCEERIVSDYTPYEPDKNISITYDTDSFYPMLTVLVSDTPKIVSEAVYTMKIDSTSLGSLNNFDIDTETGVITYDNSKGTINPGEYTVYVSLATPNSLNSSEYHFTIKEVPVSLKATPNEYSAGVLEIADISTISYTDESPDQSITELTYALQPAVKGYSIDENTGVISKNTEADGDTTVALGIKVITNLGVRSYDSVLMVTVGPPPTIEYKQTDNTTKLNAVIVSPWSAYTTGEPVLNDMNADGGWELLVYDSNIDPAAFDIDQTTGQISILSDQNLPVDTFMLGVKVTNGSGVPYTFDSLFTVYVNKRWDETNLVVDEDFQDDSGNQEFGSGFVSYYFADAVDQAIFNANLQQSENASKDKFWDIRLAKLITTKNTPAVLADAVLVLPIDLTTYPEAKDLRVSFGHTIGFNAVAIDNYERTVSYTYTALSNGSDQPADWNIIMPADDPDWPGVNWGVGYYYDDFLNNYPDPAVMGSPEAINLIPQIPYKELGGVDNTKTIYICWRVKGTNVDGKNSLFQFDNVKVQKATAFPAEEQ